jgi:membrane protease YdiL (CAAX protease family)
MTTSSAPGEPASEGDFRSRFTPDARSYFQLTRTATYGFWSALPLLLIYEVLILWINRPGGVNVRIGADVWFKSVLGSLGLGGMIVTTLVVIVLGIVIVWTERRRRGYPIPLHGDFLGWMLVESLSYAVLMPLLVTVIMAPVLAMSLAPLPDALVGPQAAEFGLLTELTLSLGAGLYEELLFRVVLVTGLFWLLRALMRGEHTRFAYVLAAVLGAFVFSAVHYVGVYADPLELSSFVYRFLLGLVLNALYLLRGFGVAAWTHAFYDVLVVTDIL